MPEGDIMRRDGEDGRRHAVLEDGLGGPFPAAKRAANTRQVRHDHVDRVSDEAPGQRGNQLADHLVVGTYALRGRLCDDLGSSYGIALGKERQDSDLDVLPARTGTEADHPALVWRAGCP